MRDAITEARLKERLHYDPDTGIFTWLKMSRQPKRLGSVAGGRCDGYIQIYLDGLIYRAHRLAWLYMTGEWPVGYLDHKNGVRDDNRWCNRPGSNEDRRTTEIADQTLTARAKLTG